MIVTSCNKYVEVSPEDIKVSSVAGSTSINVKSNTDWTVSDDADWLTVSPATGSDNGSLTATYTINTLSAPKQAVITVTGSGVDNPASVTLTQAAASEQTLEIIWTRKADMPTARGFLPTSASVLNGKIYITGGTGNSSVLDKVEEYDPSTDSWTTRAPLLNSRWGHSAEVVGGKIYVMGGCTAGPAGEATASMEIYDPDSEKWESGGNMKTARLGFGSCVANGKIYAIGGRTKEPSGDFLASVEVYEPATGTWETLSPLPVSMGYFTATAAGNYIYVVGGVTSGSGGTTVSTVYKYNISENAWSETTNVHYSRWGIASCLAGNLVVCIGGNSGPTDSGQKTVEVISTENDECFKASDMQFKRATCSVCQVNGKIYVFGGVISPDPVYTPCNYVEEGVIDLN